MGSPIFGGMTGSTDRISPRHSFEAKIRRLERGSKKLSLQGWARDLSEKRSRRVRGRGSRAGRGGYARSPADGYRATDDPRESCSRSRDGGRLSIYSVERCATPTDSSQVERAPRDSLPQQPPMTIDYCWRLPKRYTMLVTIRRLFWNRIAALELANVVRR